MTNMNTPRIILAAALAAMAALPSAAQTAQRLNANKINEFALVYTLPRTAFRAVLTAEKTVATPGPFALYARKWLNIDPVLEPSVEWRLKGARLLPLAVADADERWQVQFKAGSAPYMMLSPEGFPLTVNAKADAAAPAEEAAVAEGATASILDSDAARQAMTEEMLRSTSTAKRAELAAARIYEIRQNRADIIAGQADNMPSDGAAMQLALDQLARQEEALTAMFAGTRVTTAETRAYDFDVPMDGDDMRFVVARLSATDGLVDADDLSGQPVYAEFTDIVTADLPVDDKGRRKAFPKGGLAYRIPGSACLTLAFDGRCLLTDTFDVAQYGCVFGLDPALFTDKRQASYVVFDPLTGAVREVGAAAPAPQQ